MERTWEEIDMEMGWHAMDIECKWNGNLEALVTAHPDSLFQKDCKEELYPFLILAAKAKDLSECMQTLVLDSMFEMIRRCPSLMMKEDNWR